MNASELKIGDWVLFQGEKGTVYSIDPPSIFVKINDNIWGTTQSSGSLVPIPLTEEILKKSGFIFSKDDIDHFCLLKAYNLFLDIDNNGYHFKRKSVKYVHELQHILWVLGIDDNIKL